MTDDSFTLACEPPPELAQGLCIAAPFSQLPLGWGRTLQDAIAHALWGHPWMQGGGGGQSGLGPALRLVRPQPMDMNPMGNPSGGFP